MRYYNYIRMIKDLNALRKECDPKYHATVKVMLDECVMHFFEAHNVPFEKQGEFLTVMLEDCLDVINEYRSRRF